jgi:hypothetical protein
LRDAQQQAAQVIGYPSERSAFGPLVAMKEDQGQGCSLLFAATRIASGTINVPQADKSDF